MHTANMKHVSVKCIELPQCPTKHHEEKCSPGKRHWPNQRYIHYRKSYQVEAKSLEKWNRPLLKNDFSKFPFFLSFRSRALRLGDIKEVTVRLELLFIQIMTHRMAQSKLKRLRTKESRFMGLKVSHRVLDASP